MLRKVISGGQSGVDRAALDAALECNIPIGGYCPLGRLAEDGPIPDKYPLVELKTPSHPARTKRNIDEADATLILIADETDLTGGTLLSMRICLEASRVSGKAFGIIDMSHVEAVHNTTRFFRENPGTVNVAGPRESKHIGIYEQAKTLLLDVFKAN